MCLGLESFLLTKMTMIDVESVWHVEEEIRSVSMAAAGVDVVTFSLDIAAGTLMFELASHLDEEQANMLEGQMRLSTSYYGEGDIGSVFVTNLT